MERMTCSKILCLLLCGDIMKQKKRKSTVTGICNLLFFSIIVIIMIGGGSLFLPKCMGYETYCVLGTSMEDEIALGSLIYMKKVPKEELNKGDIIVFETNEKKGEGIIRRIADINQEENGYITKAEQSEYADANIVKYENIVGKVVKVLPYGGFITLFFQTKCGLLVAVGIVLLLIMLQLLADICVEREKLTKVSKKE